MALSQCLGEKFSVCFIFGGFAGHRTFDECPINRVMCAFIYIDGEEWKKINDYI